MTPETPEAGDRRSPAGRRLTALFQAVDPSAADDLLWRDELTGLYNRRALTRLFEQGWEAFRAEHGTLALLVIDLNLFKAVNDTYGHLTGDEVLKATARLLAEHFRKEDLLVRFGGDEFVVVAPGVDGGAARELAQRASDALRGHPIHCETKDCVVDLAVSFSIGVATWPQDGERGEQLLAVADARLYEDKERSRPPRRRNLRPLLAVLLLAAAAGIGSWIALRKGGDDAPTIVVSTPAAPASASPELVGRIHELEGIVEELNRELAARPTGEARREAEVKVRQLEGELSRLRGGAPPPSPAPTVSPSPSTAQPPAPEPAPAERRGTPAATSTSARGESTPANPRVAVPARLLQLVPPRYPPMARRLGRQATIVVEVQIGADGQVTDARAIGDAIGYGFEALAVDASRKSRWQPATLDGRPVPSTSRVSVHFRPE